MGEYGFGSNGTADPNDAIGTQLQVLQMIRQQQQAAQQQQGQRGGINRIMSLLGARGNPNGPYGGMQQRMNPNAGNPYGMGMGQLTNPGWERPAGPSNFSASYSFAPSNFSASRI